MPCIKQQRGAAVIIALLTVALVAGIAVAAVAQLGATLEGISDRFERSQAQQQALTAVDWARAVLVDDARRSSVDHLGEPWAARLPAIKMDEGEIHGEIEDMSGRFNLNNLLRDGKLDQTQKQCFLRLLSSLGISQQEADNLVAALVDWIDDDDEDIRGGSESERYRQRATQAGEGIYAVPPNMAISSLSELSQVEGFNPEIVAKLRPYVAVLPRGTLVNVNTVPAEVLYAMVPALTTENARNLVVQREQNWFKDLADFSTRASRLTPGQVDTGALAVLSVYFLVRTSAHFGKSSSSLNALVERYHDKTTILWKQSND
jgi:general secretion pathway protein K